MIESILEIDNVLTDNECKNFIESISQKQDTIKFSDSGIFKNDKYIDEELSQKIFNKIPSKYRSMYNFKRPNNLIMTAMYEPGNSFGLHTDTGLYYDTTKREKTTNTLLIYLNDDYEGGKTQFYDDNGNKTRLITPQKGKCLIFDINLWHQGNPITKGTKYWIGIEIIGDF